MVLPFSLNRRKKRQEEGRKKERQEGEEGREEGKKAWYKYKEIECNFRLN